MALKAQTMQPEARTQTLTLNYNDQEFRVEFYPARFTNDMWRKANEIQVQEGGHESNIFFLSKMLKSWEVEGENGEMLPPTPEVMDRFEVPFIQYVAKAVHRACLPGELNAATSVTGWRQTER
jgi:hypothetical protein